MADFEVDAELRLRAQAATRQLQAISDRMGQLGGQIRGTQGALGGLGRTLLGLGAGYIGINALVGGIRAGVGAAVGFNDQMERSRIGLASVMSAVEGIPFQAALGRGTDAFNRLRDAAVQSVATTQELFEIYQYAFGPIRTAGGSMEDVFNVTKNTVSAASALGVDFQQASRDLSAMLRGSAGLDVKLFSMLRSTGAIAENAEEFNRLSAPERLTRISSALGRFSEASGAYATTFAGITSTFKDIAQQLSAAAFGPIFNSFKRFLGEINTRMIANRGALESNLVSMGERVAATLDRVFGRALDGIDYVASHWDEIRHRIEVLVNRIKAMIPHLLTAAKLYAGISVGRTVVGGGLQAASTLGSVVSTVGSLAVGGGGAAVAGGGAAAAGGGAAGLGGMAMLEGVFASLSAAAGPLAIILIPIAGLITLIADKWGALTDALSPFVDLLSGVGEQFMEFLGALWGLLQPLLEILGALVIPLIAPFVAVLGLLLLVLRPLLWVLTKVAEALGWVATAVWEYVVEPIVDAFIWLIGQIGEWVSDLMGIVRDPHEGEVTEWIEPGISAAAADEERRRLEGHAMQGAPGARSQTVNDFRGSKISLKQEFREADPDRVLLDVVEDIQRYAEQRIESGYVPALSR